MSDSMPDGSTLLRAAKLSVSGISFLGAAVATISILRLMTARETVSLSNILNDAIQWYHYVFHDSIDSITNFLNANVLPFQIPYISNPLKDTLLAVILITSMAIRSVNVTSKVYPQLKKADVAMIVTAIFFSNLAILVFLGVIATLIPTYDKFDLRSVITFIITPLCVGIPAIVTENVIKARDIELDAKRIRNEISLIILLQVLVTIGTVITVVVISAY